MNCESRFMQCVQGILLAGLMMAEPVMAQESETALDAITVTATRTERDLFEVPLSVDVVEEKELRRKPHIDVADALADIPGVTVFDNAMAGGKKVMIRGEESIRLLLMIDGVKVSEQKGMSGSIIMIDDSQIERIEVIKGPASVLYGSEAIAGAVNIITKKGGPGPVGFSQRFVLDSSTESLGTQSAIFGSYKGFDYRFSASGVNAGDRKIPSGRLNHTDYSNRYYSGSLGYNWEGGRFWVRGDKYESDINVLPAEVMLMELPKWDRESYTANFELDDLSGNWKKLRVKGWYANMQKDMDTLTRAFYDTTPAIPRAGIDAMYKGMMSSGNPMVRSFAPTLRNWLESPANIGRPFVMPIGMSGGRAEITMDMEMDAFTVNDQDSYGGSVQSDWQLGDRHYLIAGGEYNQDRLIAMSDSAMSLMNYIDVYMRMPPNIPVAPIVKVAEMDMPVNMAPTSSRYKIDQGQMSFFAQDEWSFANDWKATLGARYTRVESNFKESSSQTYNALGKTTDSKVVGSAALVYTGLDNWALRANWSQGYAFPTTNRLYLGTSVGGVTTLPNPGLKPETSNNYELGARYADGNWHLDTALFYSDAKNYITPIPLPGTANMMYSNMDKAETIGAEMLLSYTFAGTGLTPYLNGTWLRRSTTSRVDGDKAYKTYDTGTPVFQGKAGTRWDRQLDGSQTVFADLNLAFATKAPWDDKLESMVERVGEDSWYTLNCSLGTEWDFGGGHHGHATLALRNLLNREYIRARNSIEDPGLHVVLSVGFTY